MKEFEFVVTDPQGIHARPAGLLVKEAKKFEERVTELEHVVACYSVGGDADFLLQVVSPDLDTYAEFSMSTIRRLPGIKEMQSIFVLKEIKPFLGYPIHSQK